MVKQNILDQLKNYTSRQAAAACLPKNTDSYKLLAEAVFEAGNDIFINLHNMEINDPVERLHGHDFFELNYTLQGYGMQSIEHNAPIQLNRGTFCIMNPNVRHNLYVPSQTDLIINIAMKKTLFDSTFWSLIGQHEHIGQFFLNYFFSQDSFGNYLLFDTSNSVNEIDMLIERICMEYLERKPYYLVTLHCLLIVFFTEIVRSNTVKINSSNLNNRVSAQIAELFNYLNANYTTASLASTASHFNYHPNYLANLIKNNTGKNFSSILNEIKLSQATYYLCNTNIPIKKIAELLGFQQLCNFYDFIKKNCHTTPGKLRQSHINPT